MRHLTWVVKFSSVISSLSWVGLFARVFHLREINWPSANVNVSLVHIFTSLQHSASLPTSHSNWELKLMSAWGQRTRWRPVGPHGTRPAIWNIWMNKRAAVKQAVSAEPAQEAESRGYSDICVSRSVCVRACVCGDESNYGITNLLPQSTPLYTYQAGSCPALHGSLAALA